MLSVRCTRTLTTRLATPVISRSLSAKGEIPETNMFWLRHQIKAKDGFHKHVNFERVIAMVALGSLGAAVASPGNFLVDQTLVLTWIAHSYWGVEAMIMDYIPLLLPVFFANVAKWLWVGFCLIMVVAFTNLNLKIGEKQGCGHIIREFFLM